MDITDHADGSITARFGVAGLEWATNWVLRQGAAARVLEPPELVARVRTIAEGIVQRYEDTVH
jgi:predicted DNA-binding transcriptional regulator YafY